MQIVWVLDNQNIVLQLHYVVTNSTGYILNLLVSHY